MSRQNIANTAPVVGANLAAEQGDHWEGEGSKSRSPLALIFFNPYFTLISRLVLGLIFLLSGLTKLGVPGAFATSINSYEMHLPSALVTLMAYGLPPLELAIGVLLLVGLWTRLSGGASAVLMVVFLVAMIQAMFRGLNPDCGCFAGQATSNPVGQAVMKALGPVGNFLSTERVGVDSLLRDLIFLALALNLVFVPTIFGIDSWRNRQRMQELGDEVSDPEETEDWAANEENTALRTGR